MRLLVEKAWHAARSAQRAALLRISLILIVNNFLKKPLDFVSFMWYIILMKDEKDFIVTTTNGTRWATTAASFAQVRLEFFGKHFGSGMEIDKIERGRLFTHEEEAELKREKDEERCR